MPATREVATLAEAVHDCRGCDLYRGTDQPVFGEGSSSATLMLIGEQPGDQEDRAGRPFVGPAGRLLDKALKSAGIDRDSVYVTNAVKHFKFARSERGQRRIHKTPSRTEVVACRPWLVAELEAVHPDIVVLLGATAAKALFGNDFRITAHRGEPLRLPDGVLSFDPQAVATVHPSAILRGPPEDRDVAFTAFVADLQLAADLAPGR